MPSLRRLNWLGCWSLGNKPSLGCCDLICRNIQAQLPDCNIIWPDGTSTYGEELKGLSRKELNQECNERKLDATGARQKLEERLLARAERLG